MNKEEKSLEARITTLEEQNDSLSTVLHQFIKTLNEIKQNQVDVSGHVASMLRTVFDSRPLNKASLAESAVLNQVDKLNHYLKSSVEAGMLDPSETVTTDSLVVAQQFSSTTKEEVNRRVLLSVTEMKPEDKTLFLGLKVGESVTAFSEAPDTYVVIHEIYEQIKNVKKNLS